MWYKITATSTGYVMVLEFANGHTHTLIEDGGHGPIEALYALAAETWTNLRIAEVSSE